MKVTVLRYRTPGGQKDTAPYFEYIGREFETHAQMANSYTAAIAQKIHREESAQREYSNSKIRRKLMRGGGGGAGPNAR